MSATGGTWDVTTIANNGTLNLKFGALSADTFSGDLINTGGRVEPEYSLGNNTN